MTTFWLRLGYKPLAIKEAHGFSGGVWALGLLSLQLQVAVVASHRQAGSLRFSSNTASWVGTGVYASPTPSLRSDLWEHLCGVANLVQGPWAFLGDFNDVSSATEVRGGAFSPARAQAFVENYEACGLLDLGAFRLSFTWYRHAQGRRPLHRRLDRALANLDWRIGFPQGSIEVLPRQHSDHNTLFLRCCPRREALVNKPFRFEAAWMDHPQYHQVITEAWRK
ncbi:uncharacterized protein LOC130725310 [Lotus japonicus]|uniref:uncharacterized protein LOC130725310 n=1 Tax=Lotus japonicus TaxID=34305 RepID=UPI0025851CEC|nr:uncharacterized protein LOC130725310 [Lotus japonicus]